MVTIFGLVSWRSISKMNDTKRTSGQGVNDSDLASRPLQGLTNGNRHQLLEVKLSEATMGGFTGLDIFHALEHVTFRYVGR